MRFKRLKTTDIGLLISISLLLTVARGDDESLDGHDVPASPVRAGNDGTEELALSASIRENTKNKGAIDAVKAGANLATNAGESISNANTSYVTSEADRTEDIEHQWVEQGPTPEPGQNQFYSDGRIKNSSTSSQQGGDGFELSNSTNVWAINDDDGNESYGRNASSIDGTYSHEKTAATIDSESEWTTQNTDGSTSVGELVLKLNKTGNRLADDHKINASEVSSNKYADGTVIYTSSDTINKTTDNYSQDTKDETTKSRWSELKANGASSVGVMEGTDESNRTVGNGTGSEIANKVWDYRGNEGTVDLGNLTRSSVRNYTLDTAGHKRNTSLDTADMAADGSISLVKAKQTKEGATGESTNNMASNETIAFLKKKADGSQKVGRIKQAKTENTKQASGNVTDSNQLKWTNFTAPGVAPKLGEKQTNVMPPEVSHLPGVENPKIPTGVLPAIQKGVNVSPGMNRPSFKRPI